MLAGGLTQTGTIGVVGGVGVPEVNRIANAFIAGAQAVNPEVVTKVSFINEWFNLATAKEAALAQIDAGADVLYAERAGVIPAAAENGLLAIGNMSDQSAEAPDSVVTSVTWNMTPTVEYVIDQVAGGGTCAQRARRLFRLAFADFIKVPAELERVADRYDAPERVGQGRAVADLAMLPFEAPDRRLYPGVVSPVERTVIQPEIAQLALDVPYDRGPG